MSRTARSAAALLAFTVALLTLLVPGMASAKGGDDGGTTTTGTSTGDFAVTLNGTTQNPAAGREYKADRVVPTGRITVTGTNVTFVIDPTTLGVYDYTLTGAPAPDRMVTAPTVVFASKVPS